MKKDNKKPILKPEISLEDVLKASVKPLKNSIPKKKKAKKK